VSTSVTPNILAEITLYPATQGGRKSTILQGEYRGVLGIGADHFSVRFAVESSNGFPAGETKIVGIQFLFPETAITSFSVGSTFTIWEGRDIGRGHVIKSPTETIPPIHFPLPTPGAAD
jgi:hypothetical protein